MAGVAASQSTNHIMQSTRSSQPLTFLSLISRSLLTLIIGITASQSAIAALDVSMSVSSGYPNPIYPGDVTSFHITIANSNATSTVTGVAFTDTMPAALVVAGAGLTSYTCVDGSGAPVAPSGTVTANLGTNTISLNGGVVPVAVSGGASGECDINVEVTSTARNTVQTNTIPVGAVSGVDTGAVSNGSQAQQSITINNLNLPVISKSFSRTTVVKSDQTVRLTITINNSSNATENLPLNTGADTPAWAIHDALPAGLQVASTPNATATCTGAGVAPAFAPSAADTSLVAIGGTVAAGGSCSLAVDLIGTDTGGAYSKAVTNTIDRNADFGNRRGLVPAANASASLSIVSLLQVGKVFSPGTIAAGQPATLTITLTNASPLNTVTLTSFTDNPIDGVGAAGYGLKVNSVATTCSGGVAAATAGNTGITLTGGSIPAASSCTITVNYTGTLQTAGTPQSFTNTIATGAVGTTDASIFSQPASHSVTVIDQLTIGKGVNTGSAGPGNPVQYTLTVSNYSATALSNVRITDVLPSGVLALPSSPAAPSLSGAGCLTLTTDIPALPASVGTPHFTIGTVPAGVGPNPSVCTVTFWAMTPTGAAVGTNLNNVIAIGGVADGNGAGTNTNASASNSVRVTVASTATVSKVFNPSSTFEGTVSQLTVTFTNLSAQALANASFTDNLPIGSSGLQLIVANPANASSTCTGATLTATPGSSSVSMSGATIPARAGNGSGAAGTCTLRVNVIGPAGNYTNTLPAGALTATETYADGTTHTASSAGPVSASLSYASALTAAKSFSPTVVNSGGKSTVTVQLGNVGTGTLNNVSVTDPLPAGMVVATPSNAYTTCGGAATVSATPGAHSAGMNGAVIPGSGQCNLLFDVTATGVSNWTNTIPIGNVTATGGVQNVAPVTATLTNSTAGAITVTNNATPNSLTAPGQVSVLTITFTNSGAVALTGMNLTDYFTNNGTAGGVATGMAISSTPGGATTCTGGIVNATAGGTSVGLTGATLAAAASCTVTVNVTLNATGTVQDTIPIGAITTDQGLSNTLSTVTSLSASANIGVTKTFIPSVIKPGDRSRLQITFINPVALTDINLAAVDNLPAGVTVPAGANPSTTCNGATVSSTSSQVTVSGGSLPPASGGVAATCVVQIDVTAAAAGTYNNLIAVGGVTATAGGSAISNPVAAPATLQVRSPVTIAKSFSPAAVPLGTPSTLTITLNNSNSIPLTGAVLTDALPANLTVALTPTASTTCVGGSVAAAPSATSVVLTGATLPSGGSCTVTVNVVSNTSGTYVNTIPGGTLTTLEGVTNDNPSSGTVIVQDPPTVSKQFSPTSIPVNGTSTLTIVLGNTNSSPATLTSALTDTLPTSPANIVVATPNGLGGTCTPGSVTATAGSGSVTYASGATIPAGGCTIIVNVTGTLNGTYNNSIPVGALRTTLGNNIQAANANLVISPLGYISGRVFNDNAVAPNGIYGGTDTPIANVTVNLSGTDYGSSGVAGGGTSVPFSASTTTDVLGNYAFTGLNPGSYTVTEPTQPAGTLNGITTAGSVSGTGTAGTATSIAATPSAVSNIVLLKNAGIVATSPNNNFAEVVPSSISGTVFLDQNNDGIKEAGDTALVGVTIQLLNGSNSVIATTTTDTSGNYSFTGLAPGTYSVREPNQPANTANGVTTAGAVGNGGTAGTATPNTVVPSVIATIVLPPNTVSAGNNFAEAPTGRQISGRVFVDSNNNGLFDGSDYGIGGYTLNLTGTDLNNLPVTQSTTTGSDGRYVFLGLAAGTYVVTEPYQPAGTNNGITTAGSTGGTATSVTTLPSVISAINLNGTNTISANNNFAEVPAPVFNAGGIFGNVYVDTNNNGVFDAGEPGIGGVTVKLTGIDTNGTVVNLTTASASDGTYQFINLMASNASGYTITETQPAAYVDGKTTIAAGNPGSALSIKPVVSGGADTISKVVLGTNALLYGYNFGELVGSSISGTVYFDANNNGVFDSGETGIGGVAINLTGTDINGNAVSLSTVTAADGSYHFTNLPPSNASGYAIAKTQPAGYLDGKASVLSGNPGSVALPQSLIAGGADVISKVVLVANSNLTAYNFGEQAGSTISGYVYADTNKNGVKDAGESGIAAVTVTLTGVDVNGATVNLSTTTAADGSYSFSKLAASGPAGYTITETQPGAYADGKTTVASGNPGTPTATKPVAAGGADAISNVVLGIGVTLADYDFGEQFGSSLSGFVYVDTNNNGVKDAGEAGIAGVTLSLTGNTASGTPVSLTTVSAADGSFTFANLAASDSSGYAVTETQPAGYTDGKTTILSGSPGSAASAKPVAVGNYDVIGGIKVTGGTNLTGYLYGELAVPSLKPPIVNGYVWLDINHSRVRPLDGSQLGQPGWTVQLKQNGTLICTVATDSSGFYQFDNLHCPGYESSGLPLGSGYAIHFSKNGNTLPNVPISGGSRGVVPPTGGEIDNITLHPSDTVIEQDLPLDPAGVVYNSQTRAPVPGATVTITGPAGFDAASQLVGGSAAQVQTVGSDGSYQFLLQNNYPSGVYTLTVGAPSGYLTAPSASLPPCSGTANIGLIPAPALIQASNGAPPLSVKPQTNPAACVGVVPGGAATTQYYLSFAITNGGSAPIVNNQIPLDPIPVGGLVVTKTTQMVNTSVGGLVPYTITVSNTQNVALNGIDVHDQMPPGFKYRTGSATRNGVTAAPIVSGRALDWSNQNFAALEKKVYTLILAVGTGVGEGEYTNQAWAAASATSPQISNLATATVRVMPDPTFDCPDIIGKVFDDKNANGYQDDGERGIPGVRLATPRGLMVTTDAEGRFHVPCPDIPNADRGSNFVMKLDDRTLPSGYRLTTENPRDVRITSGKVSKINFGATIHRVIRLELADAAFESGSDKLLPEWQKQMSTLQEQLKLRPSVVRIAYARATESKELAEQRITAIRDDIQRHWKEQKGNYSLVVETESAQ